MAKRRFTPYIIENIPIESAGGEGKAVTRHEGQVIFVDFAVPGDVVDLYVYAKKRNHSFARVHKLIQASAQRVQPFCSHFGTCGGCKWQHMSYGLQLYYKQKQVQDNFERLGKFPFPPLLPILGSDQTQYYRNKLEFTFTDRRWLQSLDSKDELTGAQHKGLGFHIPGRFDKVLDVEHCYLMDDLQNQIRIGLKNFAVEHELSFYNAHSQQGLLRNIILRTTSLGQWMLIVVFKENETSAVELVMSFLKETFPQLTSLLYIINPKVNDTIYDLDIKVFSGQEYIQEQLEDLVFNIQPKSFFQTNTMQTRKLYGVARDFAALSGTETVYDLYTGVGTIANFVARAANRVVGIEYIEEAIADARENARINNIGNTFFYAGDLKDTLNDERIARHGNPDVIITDPPRAGMHEDVVKKILELAPARVVYVSCNPATQARDIAMMAEQYTVTRVQPVDMFPHTHHVENVVLLERKT